jgi:hypothetical protein
MIQIGKPVEESFRITKPEMHGSPLAAFSGKPLTHLTPAAFIFDKYAGIA